MYEVEVKVRADAEIVRRKLMEEGATRGDAVAQVDVYYDAPHRVFEETDEALRIRRQTTVETPVETVDAAVEMVGSVSAGVLTYKGPVVEEESKTREELECRVADATTAGRILERLGFSEAGTVRKVREPFHVEEFVVTVDRVIGLGTFVEVEAEAGENDVESTRVRAQEILESLGLDPDMHIQTSYLGLLLEEGK